jgi:hypothetical protein
MYNLLTFYQYIYATCFDHNFDHHLAVNGHISSNQRHWIQYGSLFVNRLLCNYFILSVSYSEYDNVND